MITLDNVSQQHSVYTLLYIFMILLLDHGVPHTIYTGVKSWTVTREGCKVNPTSFLNGRTGSLWTE